MEFKLVHNIVKNIQDTIWNTGVKSVAALKVHTFSSKVVNFPNIQKINGIVSVSNQKRVESELKVATTTQKTILKWLKGFKLPTEIKVSNFPSPEKPAPFPKSFEVSNFPKPPEPIKNIRVSNQPTKEIEELLNAIVALDGTVKKMKLDPQINIEAPKPDTITVQSPGVTVTQQEIDYEKLASSFPAPIKVPEIDYEKLANAIASKIVTIGGGGGGSRGNGFVGRDGKPTKAMVDEQGRLVTSPDYYIADKASSGGITYTGNENSEGAWYIFRLNGDTIRYASNNNNTSYANYSAAWADKASLTYGLPSEVNF